MTDADLYEYLVEGPDPRLSAVLAATPGAAWWRAQDGGSLRGYAAAPVPAGAGWRLLRPLQRVTGPSHGAVALCHYVVETDIPAEREEEFNAWYREEHLPGLAAVPGTVVARRFLRESGGPRYVAAYDLLSPQVTGSPAWLAIRHTPWSARVRPWFCNTRRTFHVRHDPGTT